MNNYRMGVFTSVFNVTGQPAVSVPVHHDEATGLPVGVQLVAAPWREDLLLRRPASSNWHTLDHPAARRPAEAAFPGRGRRPRWTRRP